MDSKMAKQPNATESADLEVPVSNPQERTGKPPSYSMMEPKMRRIYGEFYREIYFSEKKVLDTKTQELISIAASLVAKCQGCIEGHLKKALEAGGTPEENRENPSIAAAINTPAKIHLNYIGAPKLKNKKFLSDGPPSPR